jgi:hypothetical protein
MLKLTSFIAVIIGLLLAMPLIFSNAEAGHTDAGSVSAKSDRQTTDSQLSDRIADAFRLVDVCTPGAVGDAASWCAARHAELSDPANGKSALMTFESRDEAAQTSTLSLAPAGH